jgi:succinate dehydrogenase/fumarate reductase flavoprotein subunit
MQVPDGIESNITYQRHWQETLNMLLVATLVIASALERRESRGSHWRMDYPFLDENLTAKHYAFHPSLIDPCGLVQVPEEVPTHV